MSSMQWDRNLDISIRKRLPLQQMAPSKSNGLTDRQFALIARALG